MPNWLKATGKWGSVFVILALIITLLKQIIGFIGFLTTIIKLAVIIAFVAVIVCVGFLILKSLQAAKKDKEKA